MQIAINTRFLIENKLEGIGWFTYEVTKRLIQDYPNITFHCFFDRKPSKQFIFGDNQVNHIIQPPARHPFLWWIWFEISVALKLKQLKPDVFFSPDGFACLNSTTPQVMVMHDLAYKHYPTFIPYLVLKYYQKFTPKFLKKVDHLVTVSNTTKNDIHVQFPNINTPITTAYNGVNDQLKISTVAPALVNEPYFVYVGSIHPRKNIGRLLQAFDLYKQDPQNTEKLYIVGGSGWQTSGIQQTYEQMQYKSSVVFTGHVTTSEIANYIQYAKALVYVSLFEGFGLPVVEAMRLKTPVVSSLNTSMAEIMQPHGVLVDAHDVQSICDGLKKVKQLNPTQIEDAYTHSLQYNWDNTAKTCWNVIKTVVNKTDI